MFSTNRLPAVENGCQNGIHRRRWSPKQYDYTNNIVMNNGGSCGRTNTKSTVNNKQDSTTNITTMVVTFAPPMAWFLWICPI